MAGNNNSEKDLLILFDYDGTIGASPDGQAANTPDGKRYYTFNEELIQLGALAQKNGALCLGFTNWFSENYSSAGFANYDNSPGRMRLTQGCRARGLDFQQVIVTHSYLYAYEKLKIAAEKNQMELKDYIGKLTVDERLEILGSYYKEVIEKIEKENQYDENEKGSKKEHEKIYEAVKRQEDRLNETYLVEAQQFGLGDPCHLLKQEKLGPGQHGMDKFQMVDLVRLLLPEFKVVVFDDKPEVKKTCVAAKEIDGLDITGQSVLIPKPKMGEQIKPFEDNAREWYSILNYPEAARQECLDNAKKITQQIDRQKLTDKNIEYLHATAGKNKGELQKLADKEIDQLKQQTEETIDFLQKLTDETTQKISVVSSKIPGIILTNDREKTLIQALNSYSEALQKVNKSAGTAACSAVVAAAQNLQATINQNKELFKNKTKMSDHEINQFKDMAVSAAIKQIKTNPIHHRIPEESKAKWLRELDQQKSYAHLADKLSVFQPVATKVQSGQMEQSQAVGCQALKSLILENIDHSINDYEDRQSIRQYVTRYDPSVFDTNNNNASWNTPQCKEMISNLNKATIIVSQYGSQQGGKACPAADKMAIIARALSDMYQDLLNKDGCTIDYRNTLEKKSNLLLDKAKEFEAIKPGLSK